MKIAYIGLGSNMHSPIKQIKSAIKLIEEIASTEITDVSSLYIHIPTNIFTHIHAFLAPKGRVRYTHIYAYTRIYTHIYA